MSEKKRIDIALVEWGFLESRNKAQSAIEEGLVFLKDQKLTKSNQEIDFTPDTKKSIRVESGQTTKYVSRGGTKMEGALKKTSLNVSGMRVLDVGLSTGGFSDCLLQKGVSEIVGIDVGHKQIHASLTTHPKLKSFEGLHVKNLSKEFFKNEGLGDEFDLIVCDVSFIPLRNVLPFAAPFLKAGGTALFLVKPQFEVSRDDLGKGGIVKDESLFQRVEKLIKSLFVESHFDVLDYFESSITGTDGNQEFFIYAKKKS